MTRLIIYGYLFMQIIFDERQTGDKDVKIKMSQCYRASYVSVWQNLGARQVCAGPPSCCRNRLRFCLPFAGAQNKQTNKKINQIPQRFAI
jgi:hypothetical protein